MDKQDVPYESFAKRLCKLRKTAGFNRSQFAKACGIGVSTMQNYETGLRMPQGDVLYNMAKVLRITMDDLLDPDEQSADQLEEEQGTTSAEAIRKRQQARMNRSLREARQILFADDIPPDERQRYILTMLRILLTALEDNAEELYGNDV